MRSGALILSVLAAFGPSAAAAAEWYTGAPGAASGQGPAPTSYISFFDQSAPAPTYVTPATTSVGPALADTYTTTRSPSSSYGAPSFGAAIDIAATADTKGSKFITVIGTIAPFGGFDQSGMRLRLGGVLGQYSYVGGNGIGRVTGTQSDGSFMVGYEWVTRRASFGVYGGADINNNKIDKIDVNNNSTGQATGAKIAIDFNYRPTDYTMFSGVASFSSAHNAYYARFKAGYSIGGQVYVGPEAIFMGDDFFKQWRIGGHLTGAKFGPLQIGAAGGVLVDKVRGTGMYGILDARVGF